MQQPLALLAAGKVLLHRHVDGSVEMAGHSALLPVVRTLVTIPGGVDLLDGVATEISSARKSDLDWNVLREADSISVEVQQAYLGKGFGRK